MEMPLPEDLFSVKPFEVPEGMWAKRAAEERVQAAQITILVSKPGVLVLKVNTLRR